MAAHMNPNVWKNPKEFRPERWFDENRQLQHPYQFLAFSAGDRSCVGSKLANDYLTVLLAGIIKQFNVDLKKPIRNYYYTVDGLLCARGLRVNFSPR